MGGGRCGHYDHPYRNDDSRFAKGIIIIVIPFPQRGKSSNCNDVRYSCLDGLSGHYDHSGCTVLCLVA
ncbi:hypothetical protein E0J32_08175 [Escherichia coli]|nr:hypothetical protein I3W_22900 [Escherichia coli O43 str. RM10042]EFJ3991595.1 hypothetical protein [Escherichia coli]TZC64623.1 hypothetical protein E0J32_08175 [Escherichia coli]